MKERVLYILAFKDEPLIKVGFSRNAYKRAIGLGSGRFDFSGSYLVSAKDDHAIALLERNLKTFFLAHQAISEEPMPNGNSETFHCGHPSENPSSDQGF
jgi:hypothetical protein